jgi:hypothetical protein
VVVWPALGPTAMPDFATTFLTDDLAIVAKKKRGFSDVNPLLFAVALPPLTGRFLMNLPHQFFFRPLGFAGQG